MYVMFQPYKGKLGKGKEKERETQSSRKVWGTMGKALLPAHIQVQLLQQEETLTEIKKMMEKMERGGQANNSQGPPTT